MIIKTTYNNDSISISEEQQMVYIIDVLGYSINDIEDHINTGGDVTEFIDNYEELVQYSQ